MSFLRAHKFLSGFIAVILLSVMWMAFTGTLSYPYIMADRQIQSIRHCMFGKPTFDTQDYGFRFTVSPDLCILPHRIFPDDGSIQVVPKGFYFVISEYAKGTVVDASKGTYLFERKADGRTIPIVMNALEKGGFLEGAKTDVVMNKYGVPLTVVRGAKGLDESLRFNWAFAMNGRDDILLSILSPEKGDDASFQMLLDSVELLP
jgi:hypothetical protein